MIVCYYDKLEKRSQYLPGIKYLDVLGSNITYFQVCPNCVSSATGYKKRSSSAPSWNELLTDKRGEWENKASQYNICPSWGKTSLVERSVIEPNVICSVGK